jgi:serine/threonine protein kinase
MSLGQFWQLTVASQLWEGYPWEQWRDEFLQDCRNRNQEPSAELAAQWFVSQRRMTSYQARRILEGKPGPFHFGEYRVLRPRPLWTAHTRRFEGLHVSTSHRVLLHFWTAPPESDWQTAMAWCEQHRLVRHLHLDRIYHVFEESPQRIVVTQWPEGRTVAELLAKRNRLPVGQSVQIAQQVALALGHLHSLGLAHGVVCPSEVVVQPGNHVCLLRAPLGVPTAGQLRHWQAQGLRPLADYAAPELIRTDVSPDPLTDVYALGCLLFSMIDGSPPFVGETVNEVMQQHAVERIRDLASTRGIPPGLGEMLSFLMAKRRDLRYQTADEVIDRLQPYLPAGARQTTPTRWATESYYLSDRGESLAAQPAHIQNETASVPPPIARRRESGTEISSGPDVQITTDASLPMVASSRRRIRTSQGRIRVISTGGLLFVVLLGIWWGFRPRPEDSSSSSPVPVDTVQKTTANNSSSSPNVHGGNSADPSFAAVPEKVRDDGRTLWASPTGGPPIDWAFVPAGAQFLMHVRPAQVTGNSEGNAIWEALGGTFIDWLHNWDQTAGVPFRDLEQLLLVVTPSAGGDLELTLIVTLDASQRTLIQSNLTSAVSEADGVVGQLGDWAAFLPSSDAAKLVISDAAKLSEIRAMPNAPARRQLELLRTMTDRDRSFCVLFTPNFLAADGKALLKGRWHKLRDPLLQFLGDSTQAALFSVHLGDQLYLEGSWWTEFDDQPLRVAADRRRQLTELPAKVNEYLGGITIDPYWQPLAIRYPLMIHFISQQARVGVAGRRAIMNSVAPIQAAHNLLLATELAITSQNGTVITSTAPIPKQTPISLQQLLEMPTSLVVEQQSLESVVAEFADELRQEFAVPMLRIEIVGKELQLEGITRNQQIRNWRMEQQTVRRILTQLVQRANPVAVDDVRSEQQKLIWVVDPESDPNQMTVQITTRKAARQKGWSIPAEFVSN